jgi:hypothetical protein
MHIFIKMQTSPQMNATFQQQALQHLANHPNVPAISKQNDSAKNDTMITHKHTVVQMATNQNSPAIAVN